MNELALDIFISLALVAMGCGAIVLAAAPVLVISAVIRSGQISRGERP